MISWLLKNLCWALDGILRTIIHLVYGLIMQIASVTLFQDYIFQFMNRIYTFLAIFMLFKLSISVVNYVLNPDQMTDKSKGFGKLIQNVIIVIALIIMVPQIFDWAYKLQCLILNSGVLNSVITGIASNTTSDKLYKDCFESGDECTINNDLIDENANMVTYSIMSAFVYSGKTSDDEIVPSNISGKHTHATNGNKTCALEKDGGSFYTYNGASDCLFNYKTLVTGNNTYIFLLSTACLAFVAYVFVVFVFDISIRVVKLSFLQLMAPVPIISMLDPQSGKNGMFSKWLKECTSTYLSLFIRLGAVYFAVHLIGEIVKAEICNNNLFVQAFIVLGILAFAKQLPQFIQDITGIKMGGDGLSLKKRLGNVPGLNMAAAGAMGFAGGMAANAIASGKNLWGMRKTGIKAKDVLSGVGSVFGGAGSGAFRGLTSKEKNAWKAGQGAIKGATHARNLRDSRNATGVGGISGFISRRKDDINQFIGENNDIENFEKERNKEIIDNVSAQENRAKSQIENGKGGDLSKKYFEHQNKIEELKTKIANATNEYQSCINKYNEAKNNRDIAGMNDASIKINDAQKQVDILNAELTTAQLHTNDLMDNLTYEYIDRVANNTQKDGAMETLLADYASYTKNNSQYQLPPAKANAAGRHGQAGELRGRNADIERDIHTETVRKGFNSKS